MRNTGQNLEYYPLATAFSAAEPAQDLRRSTRISVRLFAEVKIKGKQKIHRGLIKDISQHGVRLIVPQTCRLKNCDELELVIFIKDGKPWKTKGNIVSLKSLDGNHSISASFEVLIDFQQVHQIGRKDTILYFLADKICGIALKQTSSLSARPVQTMAEMDTAFHLIHDAYVKKGYCEKNSSRKHYTSYVLSPHSRTFILLDNGKIVGTISLVMDSPLGLPMDTLFKQETDTVRRPGRLLAEATLLALSPEFTRQKKFSLTNLQKLMAAFTLFKMVFNYTEFAGITDMVMTMHPKHEELYQYLKFETIGLPKPYPQARGNLGLPMHVNLERVQEMRRDPKIGSHGAGAYFFASSAEDRILQSGFQFSAEEAKIYLFHNLCLWQKLSAESRAYFQTCYSGLVPKAA